MHISYKESEDLWLEVVQYIVRNITWIILKPYILEDESIYQKLKDALDCQDKDMTRIVFKNILKLTESDSKKKAIRNARLYILNNW